MISFVLTVQRTLSNNFLFAQTTISFQTMNLLYAHLFGYLVSVGPTVLERFNCESFAMMIVSENSFLSSNPLIKRTSLRMNFEKSEILNPQTFQTPTRLLIDFLSHTQAALLQRWVLPHIMCAFCSFIQIVSVNVSVGTLSAIAADRYLVVFFPIKYRIKKRSAKLLIVFIWFFSVLAAVPALIALRVVYIPDLMNVTINQELSSALCKFEKPVY